MSSTRSFAAVLRPIGIALCGVLVGYAAGARHSSHEGRAVSSIGSTPTVQRTVPSRYSARLSTSDSPRPVDEPAITASPAPEEIAERVSAEANREIERIAPILAKRCWEGFPEEERPPIAVYQINVAFNAAGEEIARGIEEERSSPPELGDCLRQVTDTPMRIAPTGAPASAVVLLSFP